MVSEYHAFSGRIPAYQMIFGSNLVDLCGWEDDNEDLLCTQDTLLAGQFAQHWKLRTRAQEAALKEVAKSKLRGLLADNK